jgi:hypothetical protein
MSICPVGDNVDKNIHDNKNLAVPTPGNKKVYPPQATGGGTELRNESCNIVNTTKNTQGGTDLPNGESSTTNSDSVVYCEAREGWGFEWKSTWAEGEVYVAQSDEHPRASVVAWNGTSYVCIQDNIAEINNAPIPPDSSFDYKGAWTEGEVYVAYSTTHAKASTVDYEGAKWLCIQDHISEIENSPVDGGVYWARLGEGASGEGVNYWQVMALAGGNGSGGGSSGPINTKSMLDKLVDFKDSVFDWIENADLQDWLMAGAVAAGVIWAGSKVMDMISGDGTGDGNADVRYNGSPGYAGTYSAPNLRTVVSSLCDYSGIDYDASLLTGECEFTIASNTSIRSILETLSLVYQFDMVSSGGVLKFVPRHVDAITTITLEDMGFSANAMPPAPYTAKRFQGIDLPKVVNLTYYSAGLDYAQYTQTFENFLYEDGQNVNLDVPVTLSDERARQICQLALVNAHLERKNYKFTTSYKFIGVEPGDILNSPMGLIRVLKITEADEGLLEFECCEAGAEAALVASTGGLQTPTTPSAPVANSDNAIGYSGAFWIDPTNLNDQDKGVRIYAAVHGFGRAGWPGAAIYMSEDGGATYEQIQVADQSATLGLVETATPAADYHVWDNSTEIIVKLNSGSLLSLSDVAVLNGSNWAQIGQELIGFKNATLIADKTYRLTGLLRGLQGTEQYVGTHAANELFCLIDSALVRIDLADSDRGTTKKFKVVTNGSSIDLVEAEDVHIVSNNTRMWTVYKPVVGLVGQDWIITYNERARYDNQLKDYATTNHDPDWGGFGVAIMAPDGVTVKSTSVVQGTSFTYTAAQQVADFGTIQPSIKVSIVQMSQKWGGGFPVVINS